MMLVPVSRRDEAKGGIEPADSKATNKTKLDEKGEMIVKVKALRWQMNCTDQTEDIRTAISFIAGEPAVDPQRIGVMGSS